MKKVNNKAYIREVLLDSGAAVAGAKLGTSAGLVAAAISGYLKIARGRSKEKDKGKGVYYNFYLLNTRHPYVKRFVLFSDYPVMYINTVGTLEIGALFPHSQK